MTNSCLASVTHHVFLFGSHLAASAGPKIEEELWFPRPMHFLLSVQFWSNPRPSTSSLSAPGGFACRQRSSTKENCSSGLRKRMLACRKTDPASRAWPSHLKLLKFVNEENVAIRSELARFKAKDRGKAQSPSHVLYYTYPKSMHFLTTRVGL